MNAKLWVCVIVGVLVAHLSVLIIWDNVRPAGKPRPKPVERTFETSTTTFTDERGEKLKVVHEFTVETELVSPGVLKKLPPPPSPDTANTAVPAAAN